MKLSFFRFCLIFLLISLVLWFQKSSFLIYGQTALSPEELEKQKKFEREIYEEKNPTLEAKMITQTASSGIDFDVTHIERVPRYNFDAAKNWPIPGEDISFKTHIINRGNQPVGSFNFRWEIDENEVSSGSIGNLNPGQETAEILSWQWEDGAHHVEFITDPENEIQEVSETNNALRDQTNALAVGFWVEQSVYNFFNQNQYSYCQDKPCAGSNSWEDWAQRQIKEWNRIFEEGEISTRVRLDKTVVVDDCKLPLGGGWADNQPDISDKSVDLMWGFTSAKVGVIACPRDEQDGNKNLYLNNPNFQNIELPLFHELSHALHGLPDQYGLNVHKERDIIEATDDEGNSALDYLPPLGGGDMIYRNKSQDLMDDASTGFYNKYNATALNSFGNSRNTGSNYNPNPSWPLVTSNLPQKNFLKILDKNGEVIPKAKVKIFRMVWIPGFYAKKFDNQADFSGETDKEGLVEIGHNPFGEAPNCGSYRTPEECISSYNWLLLLMIKAGGQTEFQFFEYTDVNVAYWKGEIEKAVYKIKTNLTAPPQSFSLIKGWNQITWPNISGYTAKSALEDIENDCGAGTAVAMARKRKDWWESFVKNYGGENFDLQNNQNYFINVSKGCSWRP